MLILDELSRRRRFVARTCLVVDMGGLKTSLLTGFGSKEEKEGFKAWSGSSKQLSANYPDTTNRNYMINVPAAWLVEKPISSMAPSHTFSHLLTPSQVEKLITSMAPARSKDKYRVSGSKDTS